MKYKNISNKTINIKVEGSFMTIQPNEIVDISRIKYTGLEVVFVEKPIITKKKKTTKKVKK